MATTTTPLTVHREVVRIQVITLVWMTVEAAVSLGAAWSAHSPALLAFGGDSLIELLSAVVVLLRFKFRLNEARAARIAGGLLFGLAGVVVVTSVLNLLGYRKARPTVIGIVILSVSAIAMPLLAGKKRQLAAVTSSAALNADAAESALCGYMAWVALAGLLLNAVSRIRWADPAAALLLIPLIAREGWKAIRSHRTCCSAR